MQAGIDAWIDSYLANPEPAKLTEILAQLNKALPVADEKVSVASSATDTCTKFSHILDTAFNAVELNEMPEILRMGDPNHPALHSQEALGLSRSETRRETLATRRAAGQASNNQNEFEEHVNAAGLKTGRHHGVGGPHSQSGVNAKVTSTNNTTSGGKRRREGGHVANPATGDRRFKQNQVNSQTGVSRPGTPNNTGHGSSSNNRGRGQSAPGRPRSSKPHGVGRGGSRVGQDEKLFTKQRDRGGDDSTKQPTVEQIVGSDADEPVYCYCQQVSYGEMVGCDNDNCAREW